jgi:hypothetical protein
VVRQLLGHTVAEYDRFPARRLRQSIQILEHLLRRHDHMAA